MPNPIINRRVTLSGGYVFTPQALSYFSYLTVQPSTVQKIRLDKFIFRPLIDAGYFSILDRLYIAASELEQHATISLVNPSSTALTLVNAPTFTQYEGWTGNGTTQYIDTNYNPSSGGVNVTLNNNCLFLYVRGGTTTAATSIDIGSRDVVTTNLFQIVTRYTGNIAVSGNFNTTFTTIASTDPLGFWHSIRTSATNILFNKNGSNIQNINHNSTAIPNRNIYALATNNAGTAGLFSARQISIFGFGSNAIPASGLSSIINGYMTQLGKNVY